MDFDIKQLQVFVEVANNANFSKAAKLLGMAQASVSERILTLEKNTGLKLFNRMGRTVELTRAGDYLYGRSVELLKMKQEAADGLKSFLSGVEGHVTIGGSTAPGEYLLPPVLAKLTQLHPKIMVQLNIGDSNQILEQLTLGNLELGIIGKTTDSNQFIQSPIWTDQMVLAVPPDHPFAQCRRTPSRSQLIKQSWIVREEGSATALEASRVLKESRDISSTDLHVVAQIGSIAAVKECIKSGLGISLLSAATVAPETASGTLVAILLDKKYSVRQFYLTRTKMRSTSPVANEVWDFIIKNVGK